MPVYDKERILETRITRLRRLDTRFALPATIVIAQNASTDGTWLIAKRLRAELASLTGDASGPQTSHV